MHRKRQEWTFSTVMLWKRPISWNRAEKRELRKLFEAKKKSTWALLLQVNFESKP